jgi:hypothetical protein
LEAEFICKLSDYLFWRGFMPPITDYPDTYEYIYITDTNYKQVAIWECVFDGRSETWRMQIKTQQIADLFKVTLRCAEKWAVKNGVHFSGEGRRKSYHWQLNDIKKFISRPRPGRRWGTDENNNVNIDKMIHEKGVGIKLPEDLRGLIKEIGMSEVDAEREILYSAICHTPDDLYIYIRGLMDIASEKGMYVRYENDRFILEDVDSQKTGKISSNKNPLTSDNEYEKRRVLEWAEINCPDALAIFVKSNLKSKNENYSIYTQKRYQKRARMIAERIYDLWKESQSGPGK